MSVRFDAVLLTVSDMDRSIEFYRERLGLKPVMTSPGWSEFELTSDFHLGLHLADEGLPVPKGIGPSFGIVLYSDDLDGEVRRLKERGVQFTVERQEEDNIWLAEFRDPDGYSLQIFQMKRK